MKSSRIKIDISTTLMDVPQTPEMDRLEKSTPTATPYHVTRKKKEQSMSLRKIWDEKMGFQLFDVKSLHNIQQCVKQVYCFDLSFYEDKKSSSE